MPGKYILDENDQPQLCDDVMQASDKRRLAHDTIGNVEVSTVFIGLDHNWGQGAPLLWETMIFGGEHDQYRKRYSSRTDALAGHQKAMELITS